MKKLDFIIEKFIFLFMNIEFKNLADVERTLDQASEWLYREILTTAKKFGGTKKFSLILGHPEDYIDRIIKHGGLTKMRHLAREVHEHSQSVSSHKP